MTSQIDNVLTVVVRSLDALPESEDAARAREWIKELRTPIAMAGIETFTSIAHAAAAGRIKEEADRRLAQLSTQQLVRVAEANAKSLARMRDEVARQAGLWQLAKARLTSGAAALIVKGLVLAL